MPLLEGYFVDIKKLLKPLALVAVLSCFAWAPAQDKNEDAARSQVAALFKIFKDRDWKGLFAIAEFSPAVKKVTTDPVAFADEVAKSISQNDPTDAFGKLFNNMTDIVEGQAIIEGNYAYVSTTCKAKIDGQIATFVGLAKMVKVGDVWKWDLSFTDDTEKATELRVTQLLGRPNGS
jgi:hypothetical protein